MIKNNVNQKSQKDFITPNTPLYNSRILRAYINYLRRFHPYINIYEILNYSDIKLHQIEDDDYWFTQEQVNRFYTILYKLTNEKNIARNAGRYSASPDTSGYFRNYVIGLLGPQKAYEKIAELASNFVRSSKYSCKVIRKNLVEITVTPKPGAQEQPFQCENRIGYFEAIPLLFNYPIPQIDHPECIFKGGQCCRYIIRLKEKLSIRLRQIGKYVFGLILFCNLFGYILLPHSMWMVFIVLSLLGLMLFNSYTAHVEKMELLSSLTNLQISADALFEKLSANYNDIVFSIEIAHLLGTKRNLKEIIDEVIAVLKKRLDYDRAMILLADSNNEKLYYVGGYGYTEAEKKLLEDTNFNLKKIGSRGIFVRSFWEQKPFLVSDLDDIEKDLSPHSLEFARAVKAKSFICCPIISQNRSIGILAVDNVYSKRPLVQKDLDLLSGIAREIGMWIENARLTEEREKQYLRLIQVLASSIDARDPTTRGHSERVAEYAAGIARELGCSEKEQEVLRIAGLLHDYGKIAVEDNVLKKNGPLSEDEFEYVKLHAQKTMQILEIVGFDGEYADVPKIAALHHERWDGSGYPLGLRGEAIPLGARILAVADVFDALTSPRPYRKPFSSEEALKIISQDKGKKFDPQVVDAFIRYYEKKV